MSRNRINDWFITIISIVIMLTVSCSIIRYCKYTPAEGLGYTLGLVGGLMMLALFVYPVRKRLTIFSNYGKLKHWFWFHIAMGIIGPVLVMAHTRFQFSAINSIVAFTAMVLVTLSGFMGKFLKIPFWHYIHIPLLYCLVVTAIFHVIAVHMY